MSMKMIAYSQFARLYHTILQDLNKGVTIYIVEGGVVTLEIILPRDRLATAAQDMDRMGKRREKYDQLLREAKSKPNFDQQDFEKRNAYLLMDLK